jgi:hypothetical protein
MKKLLQITIFLGWIAGIVYAGLELEKIQFFQSVIARIAN